MHIITCLQCIKNVEKRLDHGFSFARVKKKRLNSKWADLELIWSFHFDVVPIFKINEQLLDEQSNTADNQPGFSSDITDYSQFIRHFSQIAN